MEPQAKKVSVIIIIILIGIIGVLGYLGNKKTTTVNKTTPQKNLTATSSNLDFDLKTYTDGQDTIKQIVVNKLITETSTTSTTKPTTKITNYTTTNIAISNNVSSSSLKYYGQQIAKTLSSYNVNEIDEIKTMLESLEQKNPAKAQALLALATSNKQIVATLLKISVPKTAEVIHLTLINILNQNASLLTDMSKILEEPALAIESADNYRVQKLSFYKVIDNINDFFKINNIIFTPEERLNIYLNI